MAMIVAVDSCPQVLSNVVQCPSAAAMVGGFRLRPRACSYRLGFSMITFAMKKSQPNSKPGKSSVVLPADSSWQSKKAKNKEDVNFAAEETRQESWESSLPLPSPPAGFVLDGDGRVVLVAPADKRIVTLIDPASGRPLDCVIRRMFRSSRGRQCFLLLPLDMPLQVLKIEDENEGVRELSDGELDVVFPTAAYALAKVRLHLVLSGFCLTARGGFCYTEEDVLDLNTEYGQVLGGGSLAEGVEVTSFLVDDSEYILYTPFDPLMFVAYKDEASGDLKIADDELLDDEFVLKAVEEENNFQALADEEESVNETLREAQ